MKIHAMLLHCFECKKTLTFLPHKDGTFYTNAAVCAEDGNHMIRILIDDLAISKLIGTDVKPII